MKNEKGAVFRALFVFVYASDLPDKAYMTRIMIRPLIAADRSTAGAVFWDAVMNGTTDFYTFDQRIAWAGKQPSHSAWRDRVRDVDGFAATRDGKLVGFMTIDARGYIDLAFVQSNQIGRGIGTRLLRRVTECATDQGITHLTTQASLKAKRFFESHGWPVIAQQSVVKNDVRLQNFRMVKHL